MLILHVRCLIMIDNITICRSLLTIMDGLVLALDDKAVAVTGKVEAPWRDSRGVMLGAHHPLAEHQSPQCA